MMSIAEVNALDQPAFVETLGWIFEDSPWVAERAFNQRPFANRQALHQAMAQTMLNAEETEQLALLRAHPDLGARARMSHASVDEQAGVGLDQLTQTEFDELHRLNSAYKQKFGFPFLYAVKGSNKHEILAALARRLAGSRDAELKEALKQVTRIAGFRLEDIVHGTLS